jgi:REP element-mobilizing transposase RayT
MPRPVLAYHICFGTYGFWLPNDPRGSNSDYVGGKNLRRFGAATKVLDRRSHAHDPHNAALRASAKRALKYPPVTLNGVQARAVARGFNSATTRTGCIIHACAIMPNHVHLVIARHPYKVEYLIGQLKGHATRELIEEQVHPFQHLLGHVEPLPSCWGARCRKIFCFTPQKVMDEISYVDSNPMKAGLRPQSWPFIDAYFPD